jgi:[acyl-carrier-protein] S-malonyltransferase
VFDLETGLSLVRARGRAMGEAAEARSGAMAAVLGLDAGTIEAVCGEIRAGGGIVQAANFNSPGQTVISGERAAVEAATEALKLAGARRVIPLPVHGAFHSPLMESAVAKMETALAAASLTNPKVPFLANAEGDFLEEADAIRASLARQITHCVRWSEIMAKIAGLGVESVIEVGPGRVLNGLWRQSGSAIAARSCGTVEEARALAEELKMQR